MPLVLYRKYRPQNFSQVVGQDLILKTLQNAILNNRIAHGYLFAGPRGTGKTSVARIFAKAINCANLSEIFEQNDKLSVPPNLHKNAESGPSQIEPCNSCISCSEINKSQSLDLVELDAASNRGVDEIRNLRESVNMMPLKSRYKVFIIDEAHMLTKEAFNAFLKTLEEPPAHAVFILATTEPEKIPLTVLSRLQRFDFKRVEPSDIIKKLKQIAKSEAVSIDQASLGLIAKEARGAFRDAEVLLDNILSQVGKKEINIEITSSILRLPIFSKILEFSEFLAKKDLKNSLSFITQIYDSGLDLASFARQLEDWLRKVLLYKISPDLASLIKRQISEEEFELLKTQANFFDKKFLENFVAGLSLAEFSLKRASIPTLPLEILLIENLS